MDYKNPSLGIDYSVIEFSYNSDKLTTINGDSRVLFLDIFDGVIAPYHNIRCIKN